MPEKRRSDYPAFLACMVLAALLMGAILAGVTFVRNFEERLCTIEAMRGIDCQWWSKADR